jgi:DNA-binding MarR family transcriptional regulator
MTQRGSNLHLPSGGRPAALGRGERPGLADRSFAHEEDPGEFSLEATERAVGRRLQGLDVDLPALAVVSNIHRAAVAMRKHLERSVLAYEGLTWTGWVVLWVIWVWEEIEASQAAVEAGLSRATLTGVQKTLVSKGLVERHEHPRDGRRVILSLSPAGHHLMRDLFPVFNRVEEAVTDDFDETEKLQLARSLRVLIRRADST